jgi:hypothetical protein
MRKIKKAFEHEYEDGKYSDESMATEIILMKSIAW